jgi:hypothetical protein
MTFKKYFVCRAKNEYIRKPSPDCQLSMICLSISNSISKVVIFSTKSNFVVRESNPFLSVVRAKYSPRYAVCMATLNSTIKLTTRFILHEGRCHNTL